MKHNNILESKCSDIRRDIEMSTFRHNSLIYDNDNDNESGEVHILKETLLLFLKKISNKLD